MVLGKGRVVEEGGARGLGVGKVEVEVHVCLVGWVGEVAVNQEVDQALLRLWRQKIRDYEKAWASSSVAKL